MTFNSLSRSNCFELWCQRPQLLPFIPKESLHQATVHIGRMDAELLVPWGKKINHFMFDIFLCVKLTPLLAFWSPRSAFCWKIFLHIWNSMIDHFSKKF